MLRRRRSRARQRSGRRSSTGAASCLPTPSTSGRSWTRRPSNRSPLLLKSNEPYAFAGLWESWKDRQAGGDLLTFTIITTDPNEVVQPLHDRMPVIIPAKDYDRWMRPGDPAQPPVDLLRPFDADKMTAWQVDRAVGNVKNDSADLIEPASAKPREVEEHTPENPGSLFS